MKAPIRRKGRLKNCGKTKVSVASTADSRVTCISGSAAHNWRTGFWCAKPAGRTFATKPVIAMEERARRTDASENGGRRMKAQISSHWWRITVPRRSQNSVLIDQRPATTNGHRCSWGHLHCWCAEVAGPDPASAAEHRPPAGFPPTCWECPPPDR